MLHFIGTGLLIVTMVALVTGKYGWLLAVPVIGYGFAWAGQFFFERNKPATFKYLFYSLGSDFKLFFAILTGKESFWSRE